MYNTSLVTPGQGAEEPPTKPTASLVADTLSKVITMITLFIQHCTSRIFITARGPRHPHLSPNGRCASQAGYLSLTGVGSITQLFLTQSLLCKEFSLEVSRLPYFSSFGVLNICILLFYLDIIIWLEFVLSILFFFDL